MTVKFCKITVYRKNSTATIHRGCVYTAVCDEYICILFKENKKHLR